MRVKALVIENWLYLSELTFPSLVSLRNHGILQSRVGKSLRSFLCVLPTLEFNVYVIHYERTGPTVSAAPEPQGKMHSLKGKLLNLPSKETDGRMSKMLRKMLSSWAEIKQYGNRIIQGRVTGPYILKFGFIFLLNSFLILYSQTIQHCCCSWKFWVKTI